MSVLDRMIQYASTRKSPLEMLKDKHRQDAADQMAKEAHQSTIALQEAKMQEIQADLSRKQASAQILKNVNAQFQIPKTASPTDIASMRQQRLETLRGAYMQAGMVDEADKIDIQLGRIQSREIAKQQATQSKRSMELQEEGAARQERAEERIIGEEQDDVQAGQARQILENPNATPEMKTAAATELQRQGKWQEWQRNKQLLDAGAKIAALSKPQTVSKDQLMQTRTWVDTVDILEDLDKESKMVIANDIAQRAAQLMQEARNRRNTITPAQAREQALVEMKEGITEGDWMWSSDKYTTPAGSTGAVNAQIRQLLMERDEAARAGDGQREIEIIQEIKRLQLGQ